MVRGTRRVVALAAVGCLIAAAGCGSDDESSGGGGGDGGSSGGQTIKVGQIVTEGGVVSFPVTARGAVKAVFDEVNAAGGVNGNKIDVTTINDAVNPQNTTAATRKLIGDGVVAFVGGDSPYDCAVNNPLYAQAKVYSIGLGIAGACFGTPFYASVGNSPATTNAVMAKWASENIGPKICIIGVNYPGFAPQFVGANKLLAGMGLKLTYQNTTIGQSANPCEHSDRRGAQGLPVGGDQPHPDADGPGAADRQAPGPRPPAHGRERPVLRPRAARASGRSARATSCPPRWSRGTRRRRATRRTSIS